MKEYWLQLRPANLMAVNGTRRRGVDLNGRPSWAGECSAIVRSPTSRRARERDLRASK